MITVAKAAYSAELTAAWKHIGKLSWHCRPSTKAVHNIHSDGSIWII